MITRLKVSHYKSLSESIVPLDVINVIVGPNGSGKSNIIDALYFIHDCAIDGIDTAVTKRHGIDSIRQWSRTRPYNIIIEINIESDIGSGQYRVIISSHKGNYIILEESGYWLGSHPRDRYKKGAAREYSLFSRERSGNIVVTSPFQEGDQVRPVKVDVGELFLTSISGRFVFPVGQLFRPIADEITYFSKYNIYPNTLRSPQIVSKEGVLLEDGANFASVLKKINSNRRFNRSKEEIISALRYLMPIVVDFQVKSAGGYYVPTLRVAEDSGDVHDFNLSQISDGTLRMMGLLTAFYQPTAPHKIAVEEPEQMLHPGALSVIRDAALDFVKDSPERNARQVFMTTHSPMLLDQFDPKYIIWSRMKKGVTEYGKVGARQLDIIKQQLFSAGELMVAEGFFQ